MIESKEADTKPLSQFFVLSEKHSTASLDEDRKLISTHRNFLLSYSQGSITINSRRTDLLLSELKKWSYHSSWSSFLFTHPSLYGIPFSHRLEVGDKPPDWDGGPGDK